LIIAHITGSLFAYTFLCDWIHAEGMPDATLSCNVVATRGFNSHHFDTKNVNKQEN